MDYPLSVVGDNGQRNEGQVSMVKSGGPACTPKGSSISAWEVAVYISRVLLVWFRIKNIMLYG